MNTITCYHGHKIHSEQLLLGKHTPDELITSSCWCSPDELMTSSCLVFFVSMNMNYVQHTIRFDLEHSMTSIKGFEILRFVLCISLPAPMAERYEA